MSNDFSIGGERFPLEDVIVTIGGRDLALFSVPYSAASLDRIVALRGLGEKAWPYWLEDWPATYALAQWLDEEAAEALGGSILDLGCGSGFLAAFLRKRFGVRVFSCDFNADACRLAALNIGRQEDGGGAATQTPGRVFCADFNAFPGKAKFTLVLGGEILYARENQAPVLTFLGHHLDIGGSAYFADPGRSSAEGFAEGAEDRGYTVEIRTLPSHAGHRNTRVYRLRRKDA